jgi:hypothetical protein
MVVNPLMPELNPSVQLCLMRFFTGDFVSWTVHFVNICVKNQQMQQLFIQFINYVWYLLHVLALHCHPQGASPNAFREMFNWGAVERILWMGVLFLVTLCARITSIDTARPSTVFYRLLLNLASLRRH